MTLVTAAMISEVRRKTNEPTTAVYSDALITEIIEKYPHMDQYEELPFDDDGVANPEWTATFDIACACGDIWEEKASAVASKFDFNADGGNYSQSQQYEQYMKQCRYFRSRRLPSTVAQVKYPREWQNDESWIGNLPEENN
jgi:hypothetical protein